MNTKLTLSIDRDVIQLAKETLREKGVSISQLVEDYLKLLIRIPNQEKNPSTPIVDELTGVAKLGDKQDERDLITEYLSEKYQ